jgi:hypothetical protein
MGGREVEEEKESHVQNICPQDTLLSVVIKPGAHLELGKPQGIAVLR